MHASPHGLQPPAMRKRCGKEEFPPGAEKGADYTLAYEVMLDRVVQQLGVVLHPHLAQDPRAIGADRVGREAELLADLRERLAGDDHPHDLVLAVRKHLVRRRAAAVFEIER